MRINPADRYLAILLRTMQESIVPDLQTGAAKASAQMVCAVLSDLLKREHGTPLLLRELIAEGEALIGELAALIGIAAAEAQVIPELASMAQLRQRHDELTVRLTDLCEELAETVDDQAIVSAALRRVAEWELSYYNRQARLPLPELPTAPPVGVPLSPKILEAFLGRDGDAVEVTGFEQLTGGFGKQTFLATVRAGDGERALVVRKMDPAPIMKHGVCNLRSEYDLLQALAPLAYPAPRPQQFCDAGFEKVDGSFYTMERIAGSPPGSYLQGVEGTVDETVFLRLAELLARLHRVPLQHFASYIREHDDPRILESSTEACYRYNLEGWRRYMRQETHLQSPHLVWLLDWLQRNVPRDPRPPVLVHGDFNVHNILVEDNRVNAILDWECAGFGAPEQDLAYIQPHISRHIDWNRFVAHYRAHGGHEIREDAMAFGMVYAALRTVLAGNRGSGNLQSGTNADVRYAMVELGFMEAFMSSALSSAAQAAERRST